MEILNSDGFHRKDLVHIHQTIPYFKLKEKLSVPINFWVRNKKCLAFFAVFSTPKV